MSQSVEGQSTGMVAGGLVDHTRRHRQRREQHMQRRPPRAAPGKRTAEMARASESMRKQPCDGMRDKAVR